MKKNIKHLKIENFNENMNLPSREENIDSIVNKITENKNMGTLFKNLSEK